MKQFVPLILALALAAGGCIPSREVTSEEVRRAWYLESDPWPQAAPMPLHMGEKRLPSRWVFQYDKSLIWATVKTVRAIDALEAGDVGDEVVFAIAPEHAELVADELVKLRHSVESLREIAEAAGKNDPGAWADGLADALVEVEKISRVAAADGSSSRSGNPAAWTTGPIVQMLAGFLNDESNGRLLAELGHPEKAALREVLAHVVLRLGFATANKNVAPSVAEGIIEAMGSAEEPARLHGTLKAMLVEALPAAAPAPADDEITRMISRVLKFTPPALRVLEAFVRQWDKMESLAIEFRRLGEEKVVAITFRVQPGRFASIAGLYPMQPELRFHHSCRVTVLPKRPSTNETVVLLEPLDGGAAEVRFNGLGWGLVRLLAIPIDNAAVRGVRVWSGQTNPGYEATTVTLLMEATGSAGDSRRMIVFHDVKELQAARQSPGLARQAVRKRLSFNYLTPHRIYEYQRDSTDGSERPK